MSLSVTNLMSARRRFYFEWIKYNHPLFLSNGMSIENFSDTKIVQYETFLERVNIPQIKYLVHESKEVLQTLEEWSLNDQLKQKIKDYEKIKRCFESGASLKPYQRHIDQQFPDHCHTSWNIQHLHIKPAEQKSGTNKILFVQICNQNAYFINISHHTQKSYRVIPLQDTKNIQEQAAYIDDKLFLHFIDDNKKTQIKHLSTIGFTQEININNSKDLKKIQGFLNNLEKDKLAELGMYTTTSKDEFYDIKLLNIIMKNWPQLQNHSLINMGFELNNTQIRTLSENGINFMTKTGCGNGYFNQRTLGTMTNNISNREFGRNKMINSCEIPRLLDLINKSVYYDKTFYPLWLYVHLTSTDENKGNGFILLMHSICYNKFSLIFSINIHMKCIFESCQNILKNKLNCSLDNITKELINSPQEYSNIINQDNHNFIYSI